METSLKNVNGSSGSNGPGQPDDAFQTESTDQFQTVLTKLRSTLALPGNNLATFVSGVDQDSSKNLDAGELGEALNVSESLARAFVVNYDAGEKDGGLDVSELDDALSLLKTLVDEDGDGRVTLQEVENFGYKYGNGNGRLTTKELEYGLMTEAVAKDIEVTPELIETFLKDIDANGNGFITDNELADALGGVEASAPDNSNPNGRTPEVSEDEETPEKAPAPDPKLSQWQQLLSTIDSIRDGKVSKTELEAFEQKYGNGDGWLTKDELIEGLKAEAEALGLSVSDEEIEQVAAVIDGDENKMLTAAELTVPLKQQSLLNSFTMS